MAIERETKSIWTNQNNKKKTIHGLHTLVNMKQNENVRFFFCLHLFVFAVNLEWVSFQIKMLYVVCDRHAYMPTKNRLGCPNESISVK